jgi:hypothetical protein
LKSKLDSVVMRSSLFVDQSGSKARQEGIERQSNGTQSASLAHGRETSEKAWLNGGRPCNLRQKLKTICISLQAQVQLVPREAERERQMEWNQSDEGTCFRIETKTNKSEHENVDKDEPNKVVDEKEGQNSAKQVGDSENWFDE